MIPSTMIWSGSRGGLLIRDVRLLEMKWTLPVLALAVLVAATLLLWPSPSVMWDGRKSFTLTLTGQSLAQTERIFYRAVRNEREGRVQCEFYQSEKMTDPDDLFRPTVLTAKGRFTVEVPTFGSATCWG